MISTRKKAILILTVLLIGIIPILPVASSSLVDADPAFIEWKYVREITVTEQSGTQLSDYQVKILLQPDDPIWLHAQYNLSDLRFVDDSGNELPYYVEYPSRPAVLYDGVYGDWSWKTVNFPDTPAAFSIWTPQTYPTAVHFEGTYNRTYITYQSETTEGNIKMVVYDHSEKKWYGSYVVAYNPRLAGGDDHSPPAIAINESGYIWVFTADSSDILVYRSANPEDPSSWVQVTSITAGNYPNPHFNSTGHLIVLYFDKSPSDSTRPTSMAVSTDGGQTWTKKQIARLEGHWIYLVVRWSSPDTVHLAFMMCYMNDTASPYYTGRYNIYHAYSSDSGNTWYLMDGTPLTLPFGEEARIYTSFPRQLYVWDMDFDENGYPYILFIEQLSENSDKGVFKLAKWNGTAWEFHNITETDWYRDMGSIVVKSSSEIHVFINYGGPFSGVRGGEIYEFISYDGGKTWIKRPITYNSPYRHFAVQRVLNWTEDIVVVWGAGEGQPSHIFFYGRAPPAVPIPVWVKVPSIPASSTTRIYMYYGKEGVSSKSDPTAVFDFFDHFTGTLRPEWTFESLGDGGSYSLTSNLGWVTITANPYTAWYSDGDFPLLYISHPQTDFVAVAKVYINPDTDYKGGAIMVRNSANGDYYLMRRGYSGGHKIQIFSWVDTASSDYEVLDVSAVDLYMRVRKVGNVYYWDYSEDGSTWVNVCNTTVDINPDQLGFIVATGGNTASSFSIKVDYFYVRKYVDPEPSVSLGSEAENVDVVEKYIQLEGVAYIEYVDVNDTLITLSPNATLELAYSELLNVTITADITNASQTNITVKLRSKLNLSSMSLNDTALSPVYIGNETLGNAVFNVYNVTILGNGTLTIYCTLPNVLWGIQLPSTLLVGENFTAVFPREVNATLYISAYVEYTWSGTLWGGESFSVENGNLVYNRTPSVYEDFSDVSDWEVTDSGGGTPVVDSSVGIQPPSYKFPDTSTTDLVASHSYKLLSHGEFVLEVWTMLQPTSDSGGFVIYLCRPSTDDKIIAIWYHVNGTLLYATYPEGSEKWVTWLQGVVQPNVWYKAVFVVSLSSNLASIYVYDEQGTLLGCVTDLDISGAKATSLGGDILFYSTPAYTGDTFVDELKIYDRKITVSASPGFEAYIYDANGSLVAGATDVDKNGVESLDMPTFDPLENVTVRIRVQRTEGISEVFNNTDAVTYRMQVDAKHVFKAFVEDYANLEFGYLYHEIIVTYGGFKVRAKDVFGQLPVYEPLVIVVENATTGAEIKRVSAHELDIGYLPAGLYRIKVLFRDIVVAEYLFSLNSTLSGSIVEVVSNLLKLTKDYRGYERSIVVPKGVNIIEYSSLSDRFPFSRMRVLLNGTGSFKLYINYIEDKPTKVNVVGNVTDLKYYWDGTYLVLEGSLGSVGEINITDLYKLRIEVYDRLGNRLPLKPMILINGSSYIGSIIEDYLYSENYVVELPVVIDGFSFYSFFDGFNETSRVVTINNTDVTLKAWYRVPTSFAEVSSYQLSSIWWWLPFIRQGGESVRVYIEGYLRDYYGDGVSGKLVTINITNIETGYTRTLNATTDASGYFRTPLIELFRGETYRVDVSFAGDDIYVGTLSTYEIKPEELPVAPLPMIPLPTEYILGIIATVIIFIGLTYAVIRALRHTIAELKPRRKYVRKRRT